MARTKAFNPGMAHIAVMLKSRDDARAEARKRVSEMVEESVKGHTAQIYEAIFKDFPDAGDSEIANSIGVSRNTVYLWRKDYKDNFEGRAIGSSPEVTPAASAVAPPFTANKVTWEGMDRLVASFSGKNLHFITYEDIAYGDSPAEADEREMENRRNKTPDQRPNWLTDEVLESMCEDAGVKLALAPWN